MNNDEFSCPLWANIKTSKNVHLKTVAHGKSFRHRDQDKELQWTILDAPEDEFSDKETSDDQNEQERKNREQDIRERDELDKRIREKSQTNLAPVTKKPKTEQDISSIREKSRQEYLKQREKQKLAQLKQEIEDEERLFKSEKRTRKEIRELEAKKKMYRIAMEMENTKGGYSGYQMPDMISKQEVSKAKDKSEQQTWEENRIKAAIKNAKRTLSRDTTLEYVNELGADVV